MRYVVPKAATVTVCPNSRALHSWCQEMCSGPYEIKRVRTGVPTYVVYFTSHVDCQMFEHAFSADMWLASDLLPL